MDSLKTKIRTLEGKERIDANIRLSSLLFQYERNADTIIHYMRLSYEDGVKYEDYAHAGNTLRNIHSAYRNFGMYDESLKMIKDLDFLVRYELWDAYYDLYRKYAESYEQKGNFGKAMEIANNMYNQARKKNHASGIMSSLYTIGLLHSYHGRTEEAVTFFKEALQIAKQLDKMPIEKFYIYLQLVSAILEADNSQYVMEIPEILAKWEADIKQFESYGNYNTKYNWLSFYSQNLVYYEKGDVNYDKIAEYCNLMEGMLQDHDAQGFYYCYGGRFILAEKGKDWAKMLYYAQKKLDLSGIFGVGQECQSQGDLLKALIHLCRTDEAIKTFEKFAALKDTINNESIAKQLSELRTVYEVDKHIAEKQRNRNYFLFAFGGCILLVIALGIWIYYSRKIAKKNKTLAIQIQELQEQQEKTEAELLNKTTFEIEDDPDDDLCPESRKNELCIAIRDIILKDKAYRDPALTRDLLVERLGTNKNIFIDAFQYCFNIPFPEFINNLRLKDTITLLEESDLSMDEISQKAGFGSLRTFQRQFQNKYNMTPKEYRKASIK
ncbi:MAG: helix-turn-helix domain-containing protein [Tannerellaceae bacterium]|jgi:AraC-like DNA-binding protein|nr:helix-turn-helix domain-containing protein [Tannerellaceae bacterium]